MKYEKQLAAARADVAALREALEWALPLAIIALEEARQERLRLGHNDIGAGTGHVGLWPEEVQKINAARAVLASPSPGEKIMAV